MGRDSRDQITAPDDGSDRRSTRYWHYDTVVFRDSEDGWFDRFLGGEWVAASGVLFPSEEEYDHMREITADEAERLIAA